MQATPQPVEFMTTAQVLSMLQISRSTLYEVAKRRDDFPRPRKMLPGSPNRFIKAEILAFMGAV